MVTNTKRLITFLLLIVSALPIKAQEAYTGTNTKMYERNALVTLNTFYTMTIEACLDKDNFSSIVESISQEHIMDEYYFSPDFIIDQNESNINSFENYVLTLKEQYGKYLSAALNDPDAFTMEISMPECLSISHMKENRYSLQLTIRYQLLVKSHNTLLYQGSTDACVCFKDMTRMTVAHIKQIKPTSSSMTTTSFISNEEPDGNNEKLPKAGQQDNDVNNQYTNSELPQSLDLLNVKFKKLSPDTMRQLKLGMGIEVSEVGKGPIKDAGIQKGFIILKINGKNIHTVKDFQNVCYASLQSKDKILFIAGIYSNKRVNYAVDLSEIPSF